MWQPDQFGRPFIVTFPGSDIFLRLKYFSLLQMVWPEWIWNCLNFEVIQSNIFTIEWLLTSLGPRLMIEFRSLGYDEISEFLFLQWLVMLFALWNNRNSTEDFNGDNKGQGVADGIISFSESHP